MALALALTGDKLSASDAKAMGMIWDVADDLLAAALEPGQRLAAMPTRALVASRHLLCVCTPHPGRATGPGA